MVNNPIIQINDSDCQNVDLNEAYNEHQNYKEIRKQTELSESVE